MYYSAKVESAHKEFQKAIGAGVIRYIPERGVLVVISRCESSRKRAGMLQEMHFRSLQQKVLLLKRTEEAQRQLESTKLASVGGYVSLLFVIFNFLCFFSCYCKQRLADQLNNVCCSYCWKNECAPI